MSIVPTLGGITFDGITPDSDGIIWCSELIEGWHDSSDVEGSRFALPYGEVLTAVHEKARALVLTGAAKPAVGSRLGDLFFIAERKLKRAMRFQYVSSLLSVAEPDITLEAFVRRAESRIRIRRGGRLTVMFFEVPLLAPDPRRYDADAITFTDLQLTTTNTTITDTATNSGDQPTPIVITIDGPATNPEITHNGLGWFLRWNDVLGGGDTLVIDTAAETVELNSVDARADLDVGSQFFPLLPGTNSLTYERTAGSGTSTAQLDYQDAYS